MKRRTLITAAIGLLGTPAIVFPQSSGKVWRIGVLLHSIREDKFRLRSLAAELGLEEGRNLQFEVRSSQGQLERLDSLAAELVAAKVDLIIAPMNPEIQAAKRATTTIPIVMMYASAPVETGLVAALARPGGNITGTTTSAPTMAGKMIELMRDLVPRLTRVAILNEPDYPGMNSYNQSCERAATAMGIKLDFLPVRTATDLDNAFRSLERNRPSAVAVAMTGVMLTSYRRIVEFAASQRLPAIYSIKLPVTDGGLMSYGPNFAAMARRNVSMIDQILKGARPADIPVEEPALFELTINLKTAKALSITVPQSLLLRADQVID